jgi:hypothetical protein
MMNDEQQNWLSFIIHHSSFEVFPWPCCLPIRTRDLIGARNRRKRDTNRRAPRRLFGWPRFNCFPGAELCSTWFRAFARQGGAASPPRGVKVALQNYN